ncbi:hypothetical protein Vadar_005356 [Vaccinium darrowii]|uniref:Uncharacterized protein n=1 Tax=Vaccinium darrowii TaxID=229202 RepID=A0ACB7WXU9_9ERIC|nr:hypothetical protein Vadar_005356 [Vaccinium darrowii]
MSESNSLPICVISDFFLGWTLASCKAFGIPRLVFHGMGVFSMAVSKIAWVQAEKFQMNTSSESDPLYLPGIEIPFVLTSADLPEGVNVPCYDDPVPLFILEVREAEFNSWGVVVNSFLELEGNYVSSLESFYQNGSKAWCVGPLCLYDNSKERFDSSLDQHQHEVIMKWLARHTAPASVIFVSFGTQAQITHAQLDEVAYGLEEAGLPFLWVVRSNSWSLPDGMEERMEGKGLIIRQWVDQQAILGHSTIGGFLSHCGWNSVLESLSVGVPILAWPMMAEQALNAKLVVQGLHVEVEVEKMQGSEAEVIVLREAIYRGVKELMEGSKGRIAREKSQALREVVKQAVEEGGSSYLSLTKLIDQLCAVSLATDKSFN